MSKRKRLLDFIDAVETSAAEVLKEHGFTQELGRAHGNEIARRLCHEYGKQVMYVPSTQTWDITERDARIIAEYGKPGPDGVRPFSQERAEQIARAEKLTMQWVYVTVRRCREQVTLDRQGRLDLPDVDEAA
jgi:Mor family transcriptional regulator